MTIENKAVTLAEHVRILGRGQGRARSMTEAEAFEAMTLMLSGKAAPEAVGAVLMLMRMKGEIAPEIAGFARAAQAHLETSAAQVHLEASAAQAHLEAGNAQANAGDWPGADLDWPCYAAGRTRGLPWVLLSAKLVATSGTRVMLHGCNGADGSIRNALGALDIPLAVTPAEAAAALDHGNIVYLPLEKVHPALFNLLNLRDVLGLRSCVNTVCRMLNPGHAPASVQGVFHPSYRELQRDAAEILGWPSLSVIKGGGGEFERHPGKGLAAFGLRSGAHWHDDLPPLFDDARRLSELEMPETSLAALWADEGAEFEGRDFARAMVMATADLALHTLGHEITAEALWRTRETRLAA
jgi:anthranilate phosphoribosyltransferase